MTALEGRIGYRFQDRELLEEALTHKSWRNEDTSCTRDNQRLEFLGDAVVGLVVSEVLFARFPSLGEGGLTWHRSRLVREDHLACVARGLDLGAHLRFGKGELRSGGADKDSILCDAYEALLAAVYLDGGLRAAEACVSAHFASALAEIGPGPARRDAKTELQELVQSRFRLQPHYVVVEAQGPDHEKRFEVEVTAGVALTTRGSGRSKKDAEQAAAAAAVAALRSGDQP